MATTLGAGLRWLAADQDDAARHIHDVVDVDPIHFESGDPKAELIWTAVRQGRARDWRVRARLAGRVMVADSRGAAAGASSTAGSG
jgi:hypothetical protein